MKFIVYLILSLFLSFATYAQVVNSSQDLEIGYVLTERDSILADTVELPEIIITKEKFDAKSQKSFLILKSRVYKTYPYAKLASERLVALNGGMARLSSKKEKKKYFKIVENYLNNEFEGRLKKLSRKQGQILVKLIHRQTGTTTYELIKTLKSNWKAFWANGTANLFDISLKEEYKPYEVNEDYLIETILVRAFKSGRLINQKPAHPINYNDLNNHWEELAKKRKNEKNN